MTAEKKLNVDPLVRAESMIACDGDYSARASMGIERYLKLSQAQSLKRIANALERVVIAQGGRVPK